MLESKDVSTWVQVSTEIPHVAVEGLLVLSYSVTIQMISIFQILVTIPKIDCTILQ